MAKSTAKSSWKLRLCVLVMSMAIGVAVVALLRNVVDKRYALPPTAPRVVLADRPYWMSPALAQQIIDSVRPIGVHSVFDQQLLIDTAKVLQVNPWIAQVTQVRRAYVSGPGDTLEVDCVYRVPTALVQWQDRYWLIDAEGYKLPEEYTSKQLPRATVGPDGRLSLRVIQGVRHAPAGSGQLWPGDDVAAGLELVKLLAGRPFAEELPMVDVSNFGGRRDSQAAQLVLITRYGTQIRWGRPPSAKDYFVEVAAGQKLQSLADIFQQMRRVDGGQPWIDVRFDQVTYPSPPQTAAAEN
jgi:hypothetical protein